MYLTQTILVDTKTKSIPLYTWDKKKFYLIQKIETKVLIANELLMSCYPVDKGIRDSLMLSLGLVFTRASATYAD